MLVIATIKRALASISKISSTVQILGESANVNKASDQIPMVPLENQNPAAAKKYHYIAVKLQ